MVYVILASIIIYMENNSCIIYNDFLPPHVNAEIYNHAIAISEKFSHAMVVGKQEEEINEKWRKIQLS